MQHLYIGRRASDAQPLQRHPDKRVVLGSSYRRINQEGRTACCRGGKSQSQVLLPQKLT